MQALLQAVQKGAECGKNGYFRAVSKNSQIVKFPQPDFCILLPRFFGLHKRTNVLVYLVAISILSIVPKGMESTLSAQARNANAGGKAFPA